MVDSTQSKPAGILEGLNEEQLKAVTTPGNMLVLAGAGSGKTKVLSTRIAYLLERNMATEDSILAVTFTNKASKEMKNRIANMRGGPVDKLCVGTFHGICNQMLREFGNRIGINPDFHIMDTTDQKAMVKRILKDLNISNDDLKARNESLGSLTNQISKIKEAGGQFNNDKTILSEVYVRYIETCKSENALDFADLMLKVNAALSNNVGGMRDHYRNRFSHILVDEFQDTNEEQYRWLSMLKRESAELFAVGDDDQLIYGFRGADPEAMKKFLNNVAAGNIVRLEVNYRSTGHILATANSIIANNTGRIGKELRTNGHSGDKVKVFEFEAGNMEAGFIAKEIKNQIARGTKPQEIAILYRSNHQSQALETAMRNHGVPYIIYGGTRFFEREEIKHVAAYLRLAFKQHDTSAFSRIANIPPRGLGARTLDPVLEMAKETETSAMGIVKDAVARTPDSKFRGFVDLMDELEMALDMMNLPDFVEYVIERSGLYKFYENSDQDESQSRLRNIEELVSSAARYTEDGKQELAAREVIAEFLSTFILEDSGEENSQSRKKAVSLMTIHAAKGLEFDYVFLNGVEEDQLPHRNSVEEGGNAIEEERRLMYVAVTRARKGLFLCHSSERWVYNQAEKRDPSRFLDELPQFAIENKRFGNPERRNSENEERGRRAPSPSR